MEEDPMKILLTRYGLISILILVLAQSALAEPLKGKVDWSEDSRSGWIELDKMTDFKKGDKLKLHIGGTAEKILVRFVAKGEDPKGAAGIDGGIIKVPESRVVQVILESDHEHILQISVHGGSEPWRLYSLGAGNGPAKLVSAERVK
jgi:hypothetical protein